jgi:hypothetical protein
LNDATRTAIGTEEARSIRQTYGGELALEPLVRVLRGSDRIFPTRVIARGPKPYLLRQALRSFDGLKFMSRGNEYGLDDYVRLNRVSAVLVLDDDAIALERYEYGNDEKTRWTSMSIAKSISTTLVGAAVKDGFIASVNDPLTKYLPELTNSSYGGVSVKELLQMTSGVRWDDTHTDPASDRRCMLELQISQEPGTILQYVSSRPRAAAPGTRWNYSTGETHIVGALLRATAGRWLSEYLSERIWSRFAMESDATWWLESRSGLECAGCGINATLRDYGRFGLFMMNDGMIRGERMLPEGWVREATEPRNIGGEHLDYGYMWWPVPSEDGSHADRAFSARGIFGQYLYVNPAKRVVIAVWSARRQPKGAEVVLDNDYFNAVVAALR